MPSTPQKPTPKNKSKARTIISFVFDLSILGLLVWFFSSPQNQSRFWTTISTGFSSAVVAVATGIHKIPGITANSSNTTKASKSETVKAESAAEAPPLFVPPPLPTEEQLKTEVPGDCFPPEATKADDSSVPEVAKLFYQPPPIPKATKHRSGHGKPVQFAKKKIKGVSLYQVTIDLNDPESFIVIRLPNKAEEANSTSFSAGHELFDSFVKRYPSAVQVNGTFFSKDEQERVMGNMVSEGKTLKYSPWENYGTTLSLREGDYPEMITTRLEGKPNWNDHWFSLTCGPRLLKEGEVWLNPDLEGFRDPHVLGAGPRSAIGFPKSRDKLFLITFLQGLTLNQEAKLMKEIGCYEAMNLDGGASKALSHDNSVVMKPGRGLTNVLVVYDSKHKAPSEVLTAWQRFQEEKTPE
ncbi:MAG: phosphodiester glycosidase family protein, partial [Candidatus Obscuribacterales bacterium]|nr:phosphodiester glycosidase family protein [Candidatus Obscuribacterales bacterium]